MKIVEGANSGSNTANLSAKNTAEINVINEDKKESTCGDKLSSCNDLVE